MRLKRSEFLPLLLWGGLAGTVNGLLGAGGGAILLLGLRRTFRKRKADTHRLFATVTAVMLPLSAFSAYRYYRLGALAAPLPTSLLFPAILGGALGALLMRRIRARLLGRIFAGVILVSGILMAVL